MFSIEQKFIDVTRKLNQLLGYKNLLQRNCTDLSGMECNLLHYLCSKDNPVCMNEFSEVMQVSHSRVTRIVDNLVKKGFVVRIPSEKDRRICYTKVTDKGLEMANISKKINIDTQSKIIKDIPLKEQLTILESMEKYIKAIEKNIEKGEYK